MTPLAEACLKVLRVEAAQPPLTAATLTRVLLVAADQEIDRVATARVGTLPRVAEICDAGAHDRREARN
jgi:hypothetical protein